MEHYLQDKAKTKAIAVYTFRAIAGPKATEMPFAQLLIGLKATMKKLEPTVAEEEITSIVQEVDRLRCGVLRVEDFA